MQVVPQQLSQSMNFKRLNSKYIVVADIHVCINHIRTKENLIFCGEEQINNKERIIYGKVMSCPAKVRKRRTKKQLIDVGIFAFSLPRISSVHRLDKVKSCRSIC